MARLGDLIKARRELLDLSLREFAKKCNMSHSYIRNLEEGDPRTGKDIIPTLSSIEKIAHAFGMAVEELLEEIGYIQYADSGLEPDGPKSAGPVNNKETVYMESEKYLPSYIAEDLMEFVLDPDSEEYVRLAKELKDRNIKAKFIRDALFKK